MIKVQVIARLRFFFFNENMYFSCYTYCFAYFRYDANVYVLNGVSI